MGHTATVIILTKKRNKGWEPFENQMTIMYLPFSSYGTGILFFIPFLLSKKTGKFNFTFSSQTLINGILGLSKRLGFFRNAKLILRESNSIFELMAGRKLKIYRAFYGFGYRKSSLVVCQTTYMKDQLVNALPALTKNLNLRVIPNPINFTDISIKSKEIITWTEGKNYLVAAGRLVPAKGFDLLIDSFHVLSSNHPDLLLMILGAGRDKDKLIQQCDKLGLQDKVFFPGYVSNVYPYFRDARACVLSSRIEGFPNVLLQMMSQNTKVVATLSAGDIDKIPGIFTCIPNSTEVLTKAIEDCLRTDTTQNRILFDNYLSQRTQESFYLGISRALAES